MVVETSSYSEDALVEQPAIELLGELGFETANGFHETKVMFGRPNRGEVVLRPRLRAALTKLNPGTSAAAIEVAVEEISRDRSSLSAVSANREIYQLLKEGVKVPIEDRAGQPAIETLHIIDWEHPESNDFLIVSQFWVSGEIYTRRADMVGFVNGLPLVLFELKAAHARLEDAFHDNLTDYKTTIPQLFWYNALIILSNGIESRVGTISAEWEHFAEWKKISDEAEPGVISLETVIRGLCDRTRLLDLTENFTIYSDLTGKLIKLMAKNHQMLGVNNAVSRLNEVSRRPEGRGRLGVFWHTQGSGKSFSMLFFSQKVLRKHPGNWTFLIVTDRQELDTQIYQTFAAAGAVTESEVQANSGQHLKELLQENHRTVFTLIQKFHTPPGVPYPELSTRDDIIVITDEAHRSQYDTLAMNMRRALPNASFIAFTGTPLLTGEALTRDVFGDYVSVYNFRDSVEDGATVPLYYENRVPEVQLTNENLNADLEALIEDADLDDEAQRKLEREFAREYHLITREERLDTVAADVVRHYLGRFEADRSEIGKAMVVSIDKATAVRMFDKVQSIWKSRIAETERAIGSTRDQTQRGDLTRLLAFMRSTDMAVVVSQAQNEEAEFQRKGLTILPHRLRMVNEKLDKKFKDPNDPFRIVFVTAMWLTGFDVPSLSIIYLDKPMRNHTLMQTIARANRVFGGKTNGLIVDYAGIFRDLERALAIYGSGVDGGAFDGESPIKSKDELIEKLREEIEATDEYCRDRGVDPIAIMNATGFFKVNLLDDATDALLFNDETKKRFLAYAGSVSLLFRAILPDVAAQQYAPSQALYAAIAKRIRSLQPTVDLSGVLRNVEELLDSSIGAEGYRIQESLESNLIDLGQIDFDALRKQFENSRKHTETERLRGSIERKLQKLVELNRTRVDYLQRFQELIDAYNAGSKNIQLFFDELVSLAQEINDEDERAVREGLSEEQLALFDLLTKPGPELTDREEDQVKQISRELLAKLKQEVLVLDWKKKQQARAQVELTIQRLLRRNLPEPYTTDEKLLKSDVLFQHVYDAYWGHGVSKYGVDPPKGRPTYA
jgi:type I restriction enzyme R subunit